MKSEALSGETGVAGLLLQQRSVLTAAPQFSEAVPLGTSYSRIVILITEVVYFVSECVKLSLRQSVAARSPRRGLDRHHSYSAPYVPIVKAPNRGDGGGRGGGEGGVKRRLI